ncbi:MAG: signal recognition particle-docking protein FtsY [Xenococcaceae cyanobacterium]
MFNWFRRQFGASEAASEELRSQEDKEQKQKSEPTQSEAQPTSPKPAPEEVSAGNEDYLNWAKAAYQNIQQRKVQETTKSPEQAQKTEVPQAELESKLEEETVTVAETETTLVESEARETEPEPEEETGVPVVETETTAVESTKTELEIETAATVAETEITVAENEIAAPTAVPAWMRKSEGLEHLKATAIETPTPEEEIQQPVQPAAADTQQTEIAFDEEFVWSAQVLAAQGRSPEDVSEEEISWLKQLRQGLGKTRRGLVNQLKAIVGQGPLNEDAVMEIEALLLQADVGIEATDYIITTLQNKLREEALPPEQAIAYLKTILRDLLDQPFQDIENPEFVPEKEALNIWLMTGVNGAGKTTTIGKIAHLAQKSGYSCLIAAADTFRAAAVEQVKVWGERSATPVIANPGKNTDPAAVVFDGITAAQSRNTELLLVDTAGRLQNKKNLMEELGKIRRIIDKKAPDAKVESLLVLDATLGQNGLRQAKVFSEVAKLSGVVLTKLDSSAKGGVALAVAQQLNLPIRFVGAGEGIEDLRPFSSYEFVEALLST